MAEHFDGSWIEEFSHPLPFGEMDEEFKSLFRYIARLLRGRLWNESDVEDVVQEVAYLIFKGGPLCWRNRRLVTTIAVRRAIDVMRKNGRSMEVLRDAPEAAYDQEIEFIRDDESRWIRGVLRAGLEPMEVETIDLIMSCDFSRREAASSIGITTAAMEKRIERAFAHAREILARHGVRSAAS